MNKINYQRLLDGIIDKHTKNGEVPTLLLHACCAPCSSYCLEYLSDFFNITVFYYNSNISLKEEYHHRLEEEKRLISEMPFANPVTITESVYDPREFFSLVKGLENEPEGGKRCEKCFRLRLSAAAQKAKELGADYFTTTLTISPLKNAALLNQIGEEEAAKHGVSWLPSDFKKREGYKRSIQLSSQYDLYRQNYCGCIFSFRADGSAKNLNNGSPKMPTYGNNVFGNVGFKQPENANI
ncbi:MAG: epoxyqueuosine reductase QueH [Ruminococcus sp.]|nr:epoxyqueuosine reductase QueH [Ruminococcus sp.]